MSTIGIHTTQNIALKQNLASVGQRLLAFSLDWLIMSAYLFVVNYLILARNNINAPAAYIITQIPALLYIPIMEILAQGQTLGKRTLGIRVVKTDGSAPGISAYLLRWLLGFVDFYLGMGGLAIILIIFTRKGQRLGDLAAGTTVVQEGQKLNTLAENQTAIGQIPQDYQPQFSQVFKLNDRDFELIHRSLRAFRNDGNRQPIYALQKKLEQKMQLEPTEMHPIAFLETLLRDYTYYSKKQAEKEGFKA